MKSDFFEPPYKKYLDPEPQVYNVIRVRTLHFTLEICNILINFPFLFLTKFSSKNNLTVFIISFYLRIPKYRIVGGIYWHKVSLARP
jgi:hypothetical protein